MKIIEFNVRITINHETLGISHENHENHENHRIPLENHETHDNLRIQFENYKIHWIHNFGEWVTCAAIEILYRNTWAAIGILQRNILHWIHNLGRWRGAFLWYHKNTL